MTIEESLYSKGEKVKRGEYKTPLVLNIIDERHDENPEKNKFKAVAAIKEFAFVFSITNENAKVIELAEIIVRINPKILDDVKLVKRYIKKAEKEINPSIKTARIPAYSLKREPMEANIKGHELASISIKSIIFSC